jgi:hypothetical protein
MPGSCSDPAEWYDAVGNRVVSAAAFRKIAGPAEAMMPTIIERPIGVIIPASTEALNFFAVWLMLALLTALLMLSLWGWLLAKVVHFPSLKDNSKRETSS